jgi:ribosomal protein L20A (L18A)
MKPFQVEGDFPMGRVRQHFVQQVAAKDEASARDRAYALLGSRYGVNRRQVQIKSTKPLGNDQVTEPSVRVELKLQ